MTLYFQQSKIIIFMFVSHPSFNLCSPWNFIYPFGLFQSIHPETVMFFFSSRGRIMLPTIFQIKFLLLCDIFSFKNFQTDTTSRKNHQKNENKYSTRAAAYLHLRCNESAAQTQRPCKALHYQCNTLLSFVKLLSMQQQLSFYSRIGVLTRVAPTTLSAHEFFSTMPLTLTGAPLLYCFML